MRVAKSAHSADTVLAKSAGGPPDDSNRAWKPLSRRVLHGMGRLTRARVDSWIRKYVQRPKAVAHTPPQIQCVLQPTLGAF
ncbi:MAG: hypothetical protein SGPRY_011392 [Prymnesium sp.]